MDKNIKDYLHLYLGCYVLIVSNGSRNKLVANAIELDKELSLSTAMKIHIKPILRPLSDITDEEMKTAFGDFHYDMSKGLGIYLALQHAATTKYLLSKHFDLFGLIDAGLAITKINIS